MFWSAVVSAGCLVGAGGCYRPVAPGAGELARGCIYMLPGVESGAWQLEQAVRGLREAGIEQAIRVIEWGDRPLWLGNLLDLERNRQRAAALADQIGQYQQSYPGRPVTLIGYSGGAGIALLIAERLAPDWCLDRLILIAAAVSPGYDLTPAAERCAEVLNFYSPGDWLVLGWGTGVFGTIDRQFCSGAGRRGFGSAGLPDHVQQIVWQPEWQTLGNDGGHGGWLARAWSREVLARFIPRERLCPTTRPADRE